MGHPSSCVFSGEVDNFDIALPVGEEKSGIQLDCFYRRGLRRSGNFSKDSRENIVKWSWSKSFTLSAFEWQLEAVQRGEGFRNFVGNYGIPIQLLGLCR